MHKDDHRDRVTVEVNIFIYPWDIYVFVEAETVHGFVYVSDDISLSSSDSCVSLHIFLYLSPLKVT